MPKYIKPDNCSENAIKFEALKQQNGRMRNG